MATDNTPVKYDAQGNALNAAGEYVRQLGKGAGWEIVRDINGANAIGIYQPRAKQTEYSLGYDTELLPYMDDKWLKKNLPELKKELDTYGSAKKADMATEYFHRVGMPNSSPDEQAQRKAQLYQAMNTYSKGITPELLAKFGGDEAKAKAYADMQAKAAGMELTGSKPDHSLESLAKFAAIASGMGYAIPALGSTALGAYGTAGGTAAGSGFSAGASAGLGGAGGVGGGTGVGALAGGTGSDLLGTEAVSSAPTAGGISGGVGETVAGVADSTPFSLSDYLGIKDTMVGRGVSGIQDAFSSPYGKAASAANTTHTILGDLTEGEKKAAATLIAGGLTLAGSALDSGGDVPSSSAGFSGFTDNPNYARTVTPQTRSIFDKFKNSPNAQSSDPYEKFFNTRKRGYADGGGVENDQIIRKAVGYKGAPDDASWQSWSNNPANVAAKQNYAQSISAIAPDVNKDPYASYGQGPEKLFFEGLDKPINSKGVGVDSPQEDVDFNQAAKRAAGYTGQFTDPNEFYTWSMSNPDSFVSYLDNLHSSNPGFTPQFVSNNSLDWNPNVGGNQNFGPTLNAALGRYVGYTGPVGGGQLGSGAKNDYFISNPGQLSTYQALRNIVDPSYKWTKSFARGGMTDGNGRSAEGAVRGAGDGKSDDIPAMLADGEHVITAQEVAALGNGSNDAGQKRLYEMRKRIRAHSTKNMGGHSPKSKDIASYMRGL